ncbi:hypothetical protein D3C86_1714890 [compost metagenome]
MLQPLVPLGLPVVTRVGVLLQVQRAVEGILLIVCRYPLGHRNNAAPSDGSPDRGGLTERQSDGLQACGDRRGSGQSKKGQALLQRRKLDRCLEHKIPFCMLDGLIQRQLTMTTKQMPVRPTICRVTQDM